MLYDPKWTPAEIEIKLESWQQVLLKAADIIEEKGWCQGKFGHAEIGFCIIGAMNEAESDIFKVAVPPLPYLTVATTKLLTHFGKLNLSYLADWNDRYGQTKENVIDTLRKVATSTVK